MDPTSLSTSTPSQGMIQALREVQPLERGRILNETYTSEDYSKRRAHFLGTHPVYKYLTHGLFRISRSDAEAVFQTQIDPVLVGVQILSVQEVRRRELLYEIQPLLPLPTTENTETIDDFAGCDGVEDSELSAKSGGHPLPSSHLGSASPMTPYPPTSYQTPHTQTDMLSYQMGDADEHLVEIVAAPVNSQITSTYATQSANHNTMPDGVQQTPPQNATYFSSTAQMASSGLFAMSAQRSTPATIPSSLIFDVASGLPQWPGGPATVAHDPALIKSIIDRLGTGSGRTKNANQATSMERIDSGIGSAPPTSNSTRLPAHTSNKIYIRHPISALANRGFHPPVKVARGKKRHASPESDDDQSIAQSVVVSSEGGPKNSYQPDRETPPRKALMVKLKVPRQALESPFNAQTALRKSPATKSKIHGGLGKSKDAVNRFEYVIVGTALPSCVEEAKNASVERLNRLQRGVEESRPRKKTTRRSKLPSLDFPPEFFDNTNLTDDLNNGVVRCICGSKHPSETISCEDCFVWQHWKCMGSGVPEDRDNGEYRCQMCDPWAHRELIATLRREQV